MCTEAHHSTFVTENAGQTPDMYAPKNSGKRIFMLVVQISQS